MANNMGIGSSNHNVMYLNNNNHNGIQTQQYYTTPQYSWENAKDMKRVLELGKQISNHIAVNYIGSLEKENRELGGRATSENNQNANDIKRVEHKNQELISQFESLIHQMMQNTFYIENSDYAKLLKEENDNLKNPDPFAHLRNHVLKCEDKKIKEKESITYLGTENYDTLCEKHERLTKRRDEIKSEQEKSKAGTSHVPYVFVKFSTSNELKELEKNLALISEKMNRIEETESANEDYLIKSTSKKDQNNTNRLQ